MFYATPVASPMDVASLPEKSCKHSRQTTNLHSILSSRSNQDNLRWDKICSFFNRMRKS